MGNGLKIGYWRLKIGVNAEDDKKSELAGQPGRVGRKQGKQCRAVQLQGCWKPCPKRGQVRQIEATGPCPGFTCFAAQWPMSAKKRSG